MNGGQKNEIFLTGSQYPTSVLSGINEGDWITPSGKEILSIFSDVFEEPEIPFLVPNDHLSFFVRFHSSELVVFRVDLLLHRFLLTAYTGINLKEIFLVHC